MQAGLFLQSGWNRPSSRLSPNPAAAEGGFSLRPTASQDPSGLWLSPQGQEDRHAMQAGLFFAIALGPEGWYTLR